LERLFDANTSWVKSDFSFHFEISYGGHLISAIKIISRQNSFVANSAYVFRQVSRVMNMLECSFAVVHEC